MKSEPGIYSFILLGLLIIVVLRVLYVAHVYLHQIEKGFENPPMVKDLDVYLVAGLAGKVFKCCMVSYIFRFPQLYARRGLVEIEDVRNFPLSLKITSSDHFDILGGVKSRMSRWG